MAKKIGSPKWMQASEDAILRPRGAPRPMSPWQENQWFQPIRETFFSNPGADAVFQIAKSDPQRVVLGFHSPSSSPVYVSTKSSVSATDGLTIQSTTLPWMIRQALEGPLANVEWFAFIPANMGILVFEVALRDWPP